MTKFILSIIFILLCPFLLGGILPIVAVFLGMPEEYIVPSFITYAMIYFTIWTGPLKEGRNI